MEADEDAGKIPNSKGFWRRNEIEARRAMLSDELQAIDPEEYEAILSNKEELARLQTIENSVKDRYSRMTHAAKVRQQNNSSWVTL